MSKNGHTKDRRFCVLSEMRDTNSINRMAARYGNAESRPVCVIDMAAPL
jgi:hypothetical protein